MIGLPKGWAEAIVGDGIQPIEVVTPANEFDEEFTYIDISSIDNKSLEIRDPKRVFAKDAPSRARRKVRQGDVLFSTVRTYLKNIASVPARLDGAVTSTGISVLRSNGAFDPRYIFHFVSQDRFTSSISLKQDGTLYPAVSDSDVSSSPVPVAPLPEQRRIVTKIDRLSARSKRARAELDRVPALVHRFKDRLLELAFSGALTAEWRRERRIRDWSITTLSALISNGPSNGWSPQSGDGATGALTLKLTATTSGKMRLDEKATKRIYETPEPTSKFWLCPGDILIQRANTIEYVGVAAIYDGPPHTYIYPDLMMRIRLTDTSATRFIWLYLNAASTKDYFRSKATGTAGNMPKINGDTVRNLPVPLMDPAERDEIVRRIEHAFAAIDRLAAEATSAQKLLDRLDQAVLAKAFRGELVPQDPNDEPANVLLERIRAERATVPAPKRGRRPKAAS